jgi:hypothetical protein
MGIIVTLGLGEIFEQRVFNDKLVGRLKNISFMCHRHCVLDIGGEE